MAVKKLSSYPKEFFDVWKIALAGKLVLELPARPTAINLRTRLYAYRKRLDEESPALAAPFKDVDLVVEPKDPANPETCPYLIRGTVLPWKAQVREMAKGLHPTETTPPVIPTGEPLSIPSTDPSDPPPPPDSMDNALKHLGFGTGDE